MRKVTRQNKAHRPQIDNKMAVPETDDKAGEFLPLFSLRKTEAEENPGQDENAQARNADEKE
jgi:hypothetical protein